MRYSASKHGLENWVRGCSSWLKTAPFDKSYTTFYWSAIVNIALSGTVFELFDVEWYHDLIWIRGCGSPLCGPHRVPGFPCSISSCPKVTQSHSNRYHSKACVRFPIRLPVTMALSCIIFEIKRDKARYWSKIVIYSYPLAFDTPVRGSPSEYCNTVWCGKTRVVGLRTDGQTDILRRHSPRYAYASRGKNKIDRKRN